MDAMRWRLMCAVLACGAALLDGREAAAQSLGGGAASPVAPGSSSSFMPSAQPLFAPAIPSVTSDPTATASGLSTPSNLMSSPFAAPFLYSSMMQASQPYYSMSGATTTGAATSGSTTSTTAGTAATASAAGRYGFGMGPGQLGLMMLATQNTGGVGSGRLSGSRPAPQSTTAPSNATAKRRNANRPGGLASRYFNRVTPHTPYPQSYYNRQSRYFP